MLIYVLLLSCMLYWITVILRDILNELKAIHTELKAGNDTQALQAGFVLAIAEDHRHKTGKG